MWRTEWKAISDDISGLLEAARFYLQGLSIKSSDPYGIAKSVLMPHCGRLFRSITAFQEQHGRQLPAIALDTLSDFTTRVGLRFGQTDGAKDPKLLQYCTAALASFRAQFDHHVSDFSAVARRLSERAFTHLQRSIVADPGIQKKWQRAFEEGETTCEKLGSAHMLLHGIWAFKVDAAGERTDLVFGETIMDLSTAQAAAEAMVLTEWKVVNSESELPRKIAEAKRQAKLYSQGSLAGFELTSHRYLVMVSKGRLNVPEDVQDNEINYRHVNIAVSPAVPSKERV